MPQGQADSSPRQLALLPLSPRWSGAAVQGGGTRQVHRLPVSAVTPQGEARGGTRQLRLASLILQGLVMSVLPCSEAHGRTGLQPRWLPLWLPGKSSSAQESPPPWRPGGLATALASLLELALGAAILVNSWV